MLLFGCRYPPLFGASAAALYRNEKFDLLAQKGAHPYDCVDSVKKVKRDITTNQGRILFQGERERRSLTYEDYERANKVWKEFNINSLREYT